jgi:hypothetical protein
MLSRAAAASIQLWVNSSKRRRSRTSARAPAGIDNKKRGRVVAVVTSATIIVEGESEVINQAEAVLCIQVPMFETKFAVQSALKIGWRRGVHAESCGGVSFRGPVWSLISRT